MIALPDTTSTAEAVRVAVGVVGVSVNLGLLAASRQNLRAVQASGRNGALLLVARGRVENEAVGLGLQSLLLLTALLAATVPDRPDISTTTRVILAVYAVVPASLVVWSVRRARRAASIAREIAAQTSEHSRVSVQGVSRAD